MNFFIGLMAGILGGLVGVGGGVIMVPFLVSLQKLSQHKAHGTSLVVLVFTGIAGAITYFRNDYIDLVAAVLVALTAAFTAKAGAHFATSLSEWKLKRSFGGFLLLVAVVLLSKSHLSALVMSDTFWYKAVVLLIAGLFSGYLSGMMGVGGGSIMVPSMVILIGMSQHVSQGTSLLAMIPIGSVGAYTHWKAGNVESSLLSGLIPGIILGTYIGGSMAHLLPEAILRSIFAVVLIGIGMQYLKTSRHATG